jgi:hypothetical protein
MYSQFIDLYFPCTGYNLFKTLPIFMHYRGNHEIKRNTGFGYLPRMEHV